MAGALLGLSLALLVVMGSGLFVLRRRRSVTVTPVPSVARSRTVGTH